MKTFLRSLVISIALGLGLWSLAVVNFSEIASSFSSGDNVSATTFNDLFTAINSNFNTAKTAIEQNETDIATLESSKQNRVNTECPAGSAIRSIAEDGTVTCETDDIGDNSTATGVESLNAMQGAIVLQAGDNVSIDDSTDGQITISTTASGLTLPFNGVEASNSQILQISNSGAGDSIVGFTFGAGTAGRFTNSGGGNDAPALIGRNLGTGTAVFGDSLSGPAFEAKSTSGDGLYMESVGDDGIHIDNADDFGILINKAGSDGIFIAQVTGGVNSGGVGIGSVGSPSILNFPNNQFSNGFMVAGAEDDGLFVGRADNDGVHVESAGNIGVYATGDLGAALFEIDDDNNISDTLKATNNGNGRAAVFGIGNNQNNNNALDVFSNSLSANSRAVQIVKTNNGSALLATHNGTGNTLHIAHNGGNGNFAIFETLGANKARIDKTGKGFFNGGTQNSGADIAEAFEVEGLARAYEPGDVMAISITGDRQATLSGEAYSTLILGVYATKPGVLLTERDVDADMSDTVPIGVVGVVPTKVTLENGPIHRGDILVASSTSGHAMRGDPSEMVFGSVLGKALEDFTEGDTGLIEVMVNVK